MLVKVAGYADASQSAESEGPRVVNGIGPEEEGEL